VTIILEKDLPMDKTDLQQTLDQIHAQLEHPEKLDPEQREMLEHLSKDIQEVLDTDDEVAAPDHPLIGRLKRSIDHFEFTHPDLTLQMGKALDILSQGGL